MVFLHVIFRMFTFIDTLGLGVAFRDSSTELPTPKKAVIILSYVGVIGSAVLGFTSATKSPFVLAVTVVLIIAFSIALFKKSSKEISK